MNRERLEILATSLETPQPPAGVDRFDMRTVGRIEEDGSKAGCAVTYTIALFEPEFLPTLYNRYGVGRGIAKAAELLDMDSRQANRLFNGFWQEEKDPDDITAAEMAQAIRDIDLTKRTRT